MTPTGTTTQSRSGPGSNRNKEEAPDYSGTQNLCFTTGVDSVSYPGYELIKKEMTKDIL